MGSRGDGRGRKGKGKDSGGSEGADEGGSEVEQRRLRFSETPIGLACLHVLGCPSLLLVFPRARHPSRLHSQRAMATLARGGHDRHQQSSTGRDTILSHHYRQTRGGSEVPWALHRTCTPSVPGWAAECLQATTALPLVAASARWCTRSVCGWPCAKVPTASLSTRSVSPPPRSRLVQEHRTGGEAAAPEPRPGRGCGSERPDPRKGPDQRRACMLTGLAR